MFETFDHTADLGLRVRADDLSGLFHEAGRALSSVLVENPNAVRAVSECQFRIEGTRRDELLFDWLNELLYRYETEQLLFAEFDVQITECGISARVRGEKIDPSRHELSHEVKAITYHGLRVEQDADGWLAEVIVDI